MANDQPMEELLRSRIAAPQDCTALVRLDKGYSGDVKYIVYDGGNRPRYILRTYGIGEVTRKRQEFECMRLAAEQGVRCSLPVETGVLPELALGFMLVTYIEGEEARDALPRLSERVQFEIGVQAGMELRKLGGIEGPPAMDSWQERMTAKYLRYREAYGGCGVSLAQEAKLLAYIDGHLHLMAGRPNRFQHDDFHAANLIVKDGALSGVIDFNRCDWGDPVFEFVKTGFFSAEVSIPFAIGQIRGYHGGVEPDAAFWRLYALYIGMTMISSVVWTQKVVPDEIDDMLARIDRVLDDHGGFERSVPKWYQAAEYLK